MSAPVVQRGEGLRPESAECTALAVSTDVGGRVPSNGWPSSQLQWGSEFKHDFCAHAHYAAHTVHTHISGSVFSLQRRRLETFSVLTSG